MTGFVPVMWAVWGVLVLITLGLKLYTGRLSRDEDDQLEPHGTAERSSDRASDRGKRDRPEEEQPRREDLTNCEEQGCDRPRKPTRQAYGSWLQAR